MSEETTQKLLSAEELKYKIRHELSWTEKTDINEDEENLIINLEECVEKMNSIVLNNKYLSSCQRRKRR